MLENLSTRNISLSDLCELFDANGISYRVSTIYGADTNEQYSAIWLNVGHLEFDSDNLLENVVTY